MNNGFDEYIEYCKANSITLECPFMCSAYGYLCNGDPYETPCGLAIQKDKNGNIIDADDEE